MWHGGVKLLYLQMYLKELIIQYSDGVNTKAKSDIDAVLNHI